MPSFDAQASEILQTLLNGYQESYQVQREWQLGDAVIPAMAQFQNQEEKFFLVRNVKMGISEAQEIVMFFLEPEVTNQVLDRVEKLIEEAEQTLADPKPGHAFSIFTAVLLTRIPTDKQLQKRIKRYKFRRDYGRGKFGWSMGRWGLMDVDSLSILANNDGRDVSKVLMKYYKP